MLSLGTMKKGGLRVLPAVLALPLLIAWGCIAEDDLTFDQRAYLLEGQLLCPVCDGQTIQESQAQIAVNMKALLREQLTEGFTNQEIRDFFVARYGDGVLAYPEPSGFGLVAWIVPIVIAVGGAAVVGMVLYDMRRSRRHPTPPPATRNPAAATPPPPDSSHLERVERELNRHHDPRGG